MPEIPVPTPALSKVEGREPAQTRPIQLLDLLHVHGQPHRFKPGETIFAAVMGRDERTGAPTVFMVNAVESQRVHQVKIIGPVKGEARYDVEIVKLAGESV